MSSSRKKNKARRDQPHVRLYAWEMETEAWHTMSCYGRALLIEMRSLYDGWRTGQNRVHMSLRQIEERLGIGRKAAEKARDELLERGWIRLLEAASFHRKVRHAPVYMLTNEAPDDKDGSIPTKDYMRWKKNTVLPEDTDDVPKEHRAPAKHARISGDGVPMEHRQHQIGAGDGVPREHTDRLPGVAG